MRAPGESIKSTRTKYDNFLNQSIKEYVGLMKAGKIREAKFALGEGMHAVMDSTSPSHQGFQVWKGNPSKFSMVCGFLTGIYSEKYKSALAHVNGELTITNSQKRSTVQKMKAFYQRAQRKLNE